VWHGSNSCSEGGWCGGTTRESRVEELQGVVDELRVVLEDAAVSGIGVELELGMW
jgi:hypothetical protein